MSYCVNCGVELDDSQKSCPLCHTPVMNPQKPWRPPDTMPYPRMVENILKYIDRRYGALLTTIALGIPVLCSVLIDLLITHSLTWSGYVTGGAICLFVWVLLPLLLKKQNIYLHILYNTAATLLYLAAIFYINNLIPQFLTFAAPIALAVCGLVYGMVPVIRSKSLRGRLFKPAIIIFQLPVFLVVLEMIIDLNLTAVFTPSWSLIAAAPCLVTGLLLVIVEQKNQLKDRIIRRLFT